MTRRFHFLDNGRMPRIPIQDPGLVGALYLPEKQGLFPLVITLGGFRGKANESRAERLASHGFAALSLAYFGCVGLPAALQEIPLEYCEKAIDWAMKHPSIDPDRIALWGGFSWRGALPSRRIGLAYADSRDRSDGADERYLWGNPNRRAGMDLSRPPAWAKCSFPRAAARFKARKNRRFSVGFDSLFSRRNEGSRRLCGIDDPR